MGRLSVWFDEEGDFLEISSGRKKGFFRDLGSGVFERVDEKGKTIGFALLNVTKRTRKELLVPLEVKFSRKVSA